VGVNHRDAAHNSSGIGCRGFTLFELIVVITIISVLAVFALNYYRKLLIEVEQSTLEYNLGSLRSALSMRFAENFVAGKTQDLIVLVGSNPMELLAEKPKNYLGQISKKDEQPVDPGHWYFDSDSKLLVYLVKNPEHFSSSLSGTPRIRFKLNPVYSEKLSAGQKIKYISGLELKSVEPYHWLPPSL